jgi:hypothetical protein
VELTELAQNYFGDTRSGSVVAPIGTLVILALTAVTILLIRNMNARLRRLPERFPDETASPDTTGTDNPGRPEEAAREGHRTG